MVRFLLCFSVISIFAFNEGYAMDRDSSSESSSESAASTPKKRKRSPSETSTPSPKRIKVEKVPIFPPLVTDSPLTAERKYFLIAKLELGKEEYSQCALKCLQQENPGEYLKKHKKKNLLSSPKFQEILGLLPHNYCFRKVFFEGREVYQNDTLIDPDAITEGKKTNLDLMKAGRAPLIQRGTNHYRVELHHLLQRDPGPIIELSHLCHMGHVDRMNMEIDVEAKKMRVAAHSLTKEEALKLRTSEQITVSNVFHSLVKSQINREAFDKWRKKYWIWRAESIEKVGLLNGKNLPSFVSPLKFFSNSPSKNDIVEEDKENLSPLISPKKVFTSPAPSEKIKMEIVIDQEIHHSLMRSIDFFSSSAPVNETKQDILLDKENFEDPLEGFFTSITPIPEFLSISSPPSSPFKMKELKGKSPMEVRNLNIVKRELFPD